MCVSFASFFVLFVSISYICLLAKFIRFSASVFSSSLSNSHFALFPLLIDFSFLRFISLSTLHAVALIIFTFHTVSFHHSFSLALIWELFRQSGKLVIAGFLTHNHARIFFHPFAHKTNAIQCFLVCLGLLHLLRQINLPKRSNGPSTIFSHYALSQYFTNLFASSFLTSLLLFATFG